MEKAGRSGLEIIYTDMRRPITKRSKQTMTAGA